ncbi:MAG: motility protein A [Alphaproteobacteria bacterium]
MRDDTIDSRQAPPTDMRALPVIRLQNPAAQPDLASILGIVLTFALIFGAILMGEGNASFVDLPAIMIVVLGTLTATAISFTTDELAKSGDVIKKTIFRKSADPARLSSTLIDLSVIAKQRGILALSNYEQELRAHPFLAHAVRMVVDGNIPQEIDRLLSQEIEVLMEYHHRSAGICRRASEIAPAMGLIGTLVGLVQMLANLENPEIIGPAMAIALLTTFYGAILGTVVMAPLAVKLEKTSKDEFLEKNLVRIAAVSIARQDNPRRLEMLLNAELPPSRRIKYYN